MLTLARHTCLPKVQGHCKRHLKSRATFILGNVANRGCVFRVGVGSSLQGRIFSQNLQTKKAAWWYLSVKLADVFISHRCPTFFLSR